MISHSNAYEKVESLGYYLLSTFYLKNNELQKCEKALSESLNYTKQTIKNTIHKMTTEQKQRLWNQYEHHFRFYRTIVAKSIDNKEKVSQLYDYLLFSKSLILDTSISNGLLDSSMLDVTWKDIQEKLQDKDIAVEFFTTPEDDEEYDTYHALVIDKKCQYPRLITLFHESDVINTPSYINIGEYIWKTILYNSYAKNIFFSPDGILHLIPIENMISDGIADLPGQYNLYRLSSTKELVRNYQTQKYSNAILYGGLDYNERLKSVTNENKDKSSSFLRETAKRGGFDPLYSTLSEIQSINKLLKSKSISTTLLYGDAGTEGSFKMLSGKGSSIIHLATHGMYVVPEDVKTQKRENNFEFLELLANEKNPVKEDIALTHSFLVMSGGNRIIQRDSISYMDEDGILTAKEISQLDLCGTDLVVLSACETALGDLYRDGIYGLQRGFKKAGVKTILMSLGKVDDEATRILMVEFYRNLMTGKTKRQSLYDAQQYLRKVENGKYDKPEFWTPFILLDGLN